MMKRYFGYAECRECKNQEGPWVLIDNVFLCEDCYEKKVKKGLLEPFSLECCKDSNNPASAGLNEDISRTTRKENL